MNATTIGLAATGKRVLQRTAHRRDAEGQSSMNMAAVEGRSVRCPDVDLDAYIKAQAVSRHLGPLDL